MVQYRFRVLALCVLLLSSVGCLDSEENPSGDSQSEQAGGALSGHKGVANPTYYKDVKPIFDARCARCHREGGIGPFDISDMEQMRPRFEHIKAYVTERIMPPWLPSAKGHKLVRDISLSDAQIATIVNWVDQKTPMGSAEDEGPALPAIVAELQSRDVVIKAQKPYTPQITPDDYRCFVLDWPRQTTTYITGFSIAPDQPSIVHHVVAYLAKEISSDSTAGSPSQIELAQSLDASDDGEGYTCFGSSLTGADVVGAWAPGVDATPYPKDTGILVPAGSKIILQVHYHIGPHIHKHSNAKFLAHVEAGIPADHSSVIFQLADTVKKEANMQFWTDRTNWVAGHKMDIPAGQKNVEHSFSFDMTTLYSLLSFTTGGLEPYASMSHGLQIHGAILHQHLLGKSISLRIDRQDGEQDLLIDIPRWDFHWQSLYFLEQPVSFAPRDKLTLECHWDNSAKGAKDANWGEGTDDEMCIAVVYVTAE